jgi:L-histidine Nalpha-methyltransferase
VPETLVTIRVHSSQFPDRVELDLVESIRRRRIDSKFHYQTRQQARAWLRLHETYSPARRDRDCQRTYSRAFDDVAGALGPGPIQIVGLGCGDAAKEARLIERIPQAHDRVSFVAIDVGTPLVLLAHARVCQLLAADRCHAVVCDLDAARELSPELAGFRSEGERRLLTCFGVVPNFRPRWIVSVLGSLLEDGDELLLGVNLAPGQDYAAAMKAIRPQYDNPLTREWLGLLLEDLGVDPADGRIRFDIEPDPVWDPLARIAAHFDFDRPRCLVVGNEEFRFARGDRLTLFLSYRHTADSIRGLFARDQIEVTREWIAASGEEGLFLCRANRQSAASGQGTQTAR